MIKKFTILSLSCHLSSALIATENAASFLDQASIRYISYHEIFPGQTRYSSQNVSEKVKNALTSQSAFWNETSQCWTYKYNQGTSILPEQKALPVIQACFGYVLIDGHHDILASIQLQAEMIPIKVIKDLSSLDRKDFWNVAEQNEWVYLYSITGKKVNSCTQFSDLQDDPNRYFAAISARKYVTSSSGQYITTGPEYPLWIKVDKDIPFIEFKIADALYAKGFIYPAKQMGNDPSIEMIEQARQILLQATIEGLRIVPTRTHCEQIRWEAIE